MHYLGDDKYEIFIGGRFIELTRLEIITFLEDAQYFLEDLGYVNINHSSLDEILDENIRGYNPNTKIKQLFAKYYDDTKTKREVFTKISKELKISFKAVEKAFYLK